MKNMESKLKSEHSARSVGTPPTVPFRQWRADIAPPAPERHRTFSLQTFSLQTSSPEPQPLVPSP